MPRASPFVPPPQLLWLLSFSLLLPRFVIEKQPDVVLRSPQLGVPGKKLSSFDVACDA